MLGGPCAEEEKAPFREVEPEDNEIGVMDADTLNFMVYREATYAADAMYFQRGLHPEITWMMRAILFDWMMEVATEFSLKRETYCYATNYLDRFLSTKANVRKAELQLVGVSALFLAAKMEEVYCPKVADFAKSTDNGYSSEQIVAMEQLIAKQLQFLLTPPTLCTWTNWYMGQWDVYLETNEFAILHPLVSRLRAQRSDAEGEAAAPLRFKSQNELAYARFREVFQVLDAMTLDVQYLQYRPRALVASTLYLVLGMHAGAFEQEEVAASFTRSSAGFLDGEAEEKEAFNDLFIDFLFLSFGFNLAELAPTVMYAS